MKKYANLHPPLVARIAAEESKQKDPEKAVKTRLHRLYGAYTQPNAHKKAGAVLDAWEASGAASPAPTEALLRLHASTRERLPYYTELYAFILNHTDPPASILDVGCGFNPFSLPILFSLMPVNRLHTYHAYDIDVQQAALLNRFFIRHSLPPTAGCLDLAVQTPDVEVDLALMFKLLPVLEAQSPAVSGTAAGGFRLASRLKARHLAITYPLKSLGGNEKGMERNYRHAFETALNAGQLSPFTLLTEKRIGTEWVYILRN
jgi:16S rRNA (guanine(1405)-N(7))-methyltransferase